MKRAQFETEKLEAKFYRQLFYVEGPPQIQDLPDTIMFRLGLAY